ncbi:MULTISPECIES: hypothetical protein [unclassified Acidovorax]|uniref:hypothetical protein n=1 Tax=unclassified Acidovorax TaxID=2684926 RepID=UPI000AA60EFF|nr:MULTISPECIES: hypothetical protein [unclassified Acidovorax]
MNILKNHMQNFKNFSSLQSTSTASAFSALIGAFTLAAALAFSLIPTTGLAKTSGDKPTGAMNNPASPSKKKGPKKVTYQRSSSEESPGERDRRMARECKGLHNAGACRGYTR